MRSSSFITLSVLFHLLCIVAVAMVPQTKIDPEAKPAEMIEIATPGPEAASAAPAVADIAPVATPAEIAPAPAPAPKKISKPKAVAALPKKVEVIAAQATEEVEKLDPEVSDEDMPSVTPIAEAVAAEPKPEMIPVKDMPPVGIEAAADAETEAVSEDLDKTEDPSPVAVAEVTGAGSNAGNARSYLDLKQYSGNPSPIYPMKARQEKRQGEVELVYRVTSQGTVSDLKILKSSGHADLDKAATDAISRYRFISGQEGWTKHPVVFSLKGPEETMPSRLRAQ